MKKYQPLPVVILLLINACSQLSGEYASKKKSDQLRKQFLDEDNILVIAHRGDWRYAPENSILALENAIEMGVDMVEIDLKKTRDNKLILMHDQTLDRTTTGKGLVADHTLDQIQKLYLKDGAGHKTLYKIPTLEEALNVCKGKVLINLDKAFAYFDKVYPILKKTNTADQIILKGYNKTYKEVSGQLGTYMDSIIYMPIIRLGGKNYQKLIAELGTHHYEAVEFTFETDTFSIIAEFPQMASQGTRVWVNSLYPEHNAFHHDDLALTDPESVYGWYVEKGISMIQTDRPEFLLDHLRKKGLHQ